MRILAVFIVLSCIGCSDAQQYRFTIRGELEGVKYGKAFLTFPFQDEVICSTCIEGGKFELKGTVKEPGRFILKVNRQQVEFFMDGKQVELRCPYDELSVKHVKGSPANDLAQEYDALVKEDYYGQRERFFAEYKKASGAGDQRAADEAMTQALLMEEVRFRLTRDFVKEHPDNIFSAYIAENLASRETYEKGKALYDLLESPARETAWGQKLKQRVEELAASAEGAACPEFTVRDEEGKEVTLQSLKGTILVLDFWASWCGPCRQEMKSLKEQYKEFGEKGVHFVSISLDDSEEKWKKACEEEQIPWLSTRAEGGWSKSEVRKAFGIESIPHIVLVDKEGKIAAKNARRNLLRDKIGGLLNK